ncbi:MAG TPA: class I tRNA ligase family protein, partial [Candidatus Thermoplasmatota archaeon]
WKQSAPAEISKCRTCGKDEFDGEEKVFDTWMDSSSSQMYVLHYLTEPQWFAKNYPASIRCNGRDIIRTWLYYSTLKSRLLVNKKPYEHAWITGLGMDEKGRKMSKSLGNVIDPDDILKSDGADAFRFWAASECTVGDDFRISKDRIGGARKFLSKVYNVARFVSSFEETKRPAKLDAADEWILAELNKVIKEAREGFENFDFFRPANGLRDFVWNLFAPHYLEMAKRRAFNGDAAAIWTLHTTLRAVLLILAPIAPFMPYRLCQELYGFDVHAAKLAEPIPSVNDAMREKTPHVETFNSSVWKQKKEKGLSLNAPMSGVEVPPELAAFRETLAAMHNLS